MTEIIPYLHQIGARELRECENADLIIDMGGIFFMTYAQAIVEGHRDGLKRQKWMSVPIISLEIDEVEDEPFRDHEQRLHHLHEVANIAAGFIQIESNVYTLCLAGQNRSGFMNTLIMWHLGYTTEEAIKIVQGRREGALNNRQMIDFLIKLDAIDEDD